MGIEPRLFDLDLQLFVDLILSFIIIVPVIIGVIIIVKVSRDNRKSNCDNCPYRDINNTNH